MEIGTWVSAGIAVIALLLSLYPHLQQRQVEQRIARQAASMAMLDRWVGMREERWTAWSWIRSLESTTWTQAANSSEYKQLSGVLLLMSDLLRFTRGLRRWNSEWRWMKGLLHGGSETLLPWKLHLGTTSWNCKRTLGPGVGDCWNGTVVGAHQGVSPGSPDAAAWVL